MLSDDGIGSRHISLAVVYALNQGSLFLFAVGSEMGFFCLNFLNMDFVKSFSEDERNLPLTFKAEKLGKWTT